MEKGKLKTNLAIYYLILPLTALAVGREGTATPRVFDNDTQVYSAALKHGLPSQSNKVLILEDSLPDHFSATDEKLTEKISLEIGITSECVEDWRFKNKGSTKIRFKISSQDDINFLTSKNLDTLFSEKTAKENWEIFSKRYQDYDGFIAISQIGYNKTKDQALLLLEHHCGAKCGTGKFVALTKDNNNWEVKSNLTVWLAY